MAPTYDVFISHAGEDKAPLAVLIYERLRRRGISAFLDERELLVAGDAVREMDEAMRTAFAGLFILSPEFALKPYPILEAECFLSRAGLLGDESGESRTIRPEIIPVFYRLPVAGCRYAGAFESTECDKEVRERFNERVKRGETSLEKVLGCLALLSTRTGVENKSGIGNDDTEEMKGRRLELAEKICDKVTGVLMRRGRRIEAGSQSRRLNELSEEELHASFDDPKNPQEVVMDFSGAMEVGEPQTVEAKVLREVLQRDGGRKIVSLFGDGGVGKSCILREVARHEIVRKRFTGGVYFVTLGMDASVDTLRLELLRILRNSGGKQIAEKLRNEKTIDVLLGEIGKLLRKAKSLVMLDDIWERNGISAKTVSDVSKVMSHVHGGIVVITTRHANVASRGDVRIAIKPREVVSDVTRSIILEYAKCRVGTIEKENVEWVVEKLQVIGGGLPVCLAVIGRGVGRWRVLVGERAWLMYWERIRDRPETLLNANVDDYGALKTSLRIALEMLKESEETGTEEFVYSWSDMYGSFSVMKKQKIIPVFVLERMWKLRTKGEVQMVLIGFSSVGLGEIMFQENEMKGFKVHDLMHDFSISLVSEAGRRVWHRRLLDGYICSTDESAREWWSLDNDGYLFENISRHLMESGCSTELVRLLLTAEWTNTRLKYGGLIAWLQDFYYCLEETDRSIENENGKETLDGLRLVRDAVCKCWTLLGVNERTQLAFQVYGRLQESKEWPVREYLESVKRWQRGIWLKPDRECWPRPGEELSEEIKLGDELPLSLVLSGAPLCAVVGTREGGLVVINVEERRIVKKCAGHRSAVRQVGISNEEGHIVSYSLDGTVRRWDMETGAEMQVSRLNDTNRPERRQTISLCPDDCPTGLQYLSYSKTVAFSSDGKVMVVGSEDGKIVLWDTETGEKVGNELHGFECAVRCVGISSDGTHVVAGGEDGYVRMWDLSTRTQLWAVPHSHGKEVRCIAFSQDGKLVVSGSTDRTLRMWNAKTGEQIGSPLCGHESEVWCVTFSLDGRTIASGGLEGSIRIWDVEEREQVGQQLRGSSMGVFAVAFTRDGRVAVSAGRESVRFWNLMDAAASRKDQISAHFAVVTCLAASLDKSFYVSAHAAYSPTMHSKLCIWSAESGKQTGEPMHLGECIVSCVSISPDGLHVVCGMADGMMKVFDVMSSSQVGNELCSHTDIVRAVAFSADGRWIVSVSDDKTVRVRSWDTHAQMPLSEGSVRRAGMKRRLGPDEADIARRVDLGKESVHKHICEISCVTFNADGRRIIFGGQDGKLCVWEVGSANRVCSANSKHRTGIARIELLAGDLIRSLDTRGHEIRWRLDSAEGVTFISEVGRGRRLERLEGEGGMVLPRSDEVVCAGRHVRRVTDGAVIATLPAESWLLENTWHYDSSRGVVVNGLWDGRVIFSRFTV